MAEPGVYTILLDGRSYDAFVEDTPAGMVVSIEGHRFEIEARDPRRWSRKSVGGGAAAVQSILSPMPGKVIRVLAAPGDEVISGQGIVVVEAMKMQNELKSNRDGPGPRRRGQGRRDSHRRRTPRHNRITTAVDALSIG